MGLKSIGIIAKIEIELIVAFEIVNMGPISFYLGLKIDRNCEKKTIKLFNLHIFKKS